MTERFAVISKSYREQIEPIQDILHGLCGQIERPLLEWLRDLVLAVAPTVMRVEATTREYENGFFFTDDLWCVLDNGEEGALIELEEAAGVGGDDLDDCLTELSNHFGPLTHRSLLTVDLRRLTADVR